ncbi:MAG: hypothetical protein NTW93_02880 [Phycisphaerae bacterium]|jgi:hypothetical protein|nr:hypothetical protein [Phycisphaerae bacterium]
MPDTDDLSLIVLKGHLLIEEMLIDIRDKLFPHAEYLDSVNINFNQLLNVIRSAIKSKHDHKSWDLIVAFNRLRNKLIHNLEPPELKSLLNQLFNVYSHTQPYEEIQIDKSDETELDTAQRLKNVVIDCMQFLMSVLSLYNK